MLHLAYCTYGEMDITAVFGTVILGSSPGRCTAFRKTCTAACFLAVQGGDMSAGQSSRGREHFADFEH